ncbi:C4-dicarboxylic acid transporter DauA, partial [Bacillus sp. AFS076308]
TLGFTAGIGIVIATLQLKDLLGLNTAGHAEHYVEQLGVLILALPSARPGDGIIGITCLAVLIVWPKWVPRIPGHL